VAKKRFKGEGTIFLDSNGYWVAELTLPNGKKNENIQRPKKSLKTGCIPNGKRSGMDYGLKMEN
jgi:hypothetical protein